MAGMLRCTHRILIPFGLYTFKSAGSSFVPVARRVVNAVVANLVRERVTEKNSDQIQEKKPWMLQIMTISTNKIGSELSCMQNRNGLILSALINTKIFET